MIRISFGLANTLADVDTLIDALATIANGSYRGNYTFDARDGTYRPRGWQPNHAEYFSFDQPAPVRAAPAAAIC
jgi:hypothetical protein